MEIDMRLIDEVKKYEFIYDLKSEDYKNRAKKDKAWGKIANALGLEVHVCQKRWKSMRDTYKKHKIKMLRIPEEYAKRRPWSYFKCLTFLDTVQSTRRSFESNLRSKEGCLDEDTIADCSQSTRDLSFQHTPRSKVKVLDEDTSADCSQTTRDSFNIEESMVYLSPPQPKRSREASSESLEELPQRFEEIFNKPAFSISRIEEECSPNAKSKNCTEQLFAALANKVTSSNLTPNQINCVESSVVAFVYQKLAEVQKNTHPHQ